MRRFFYTSLIILALVISAAGVAPAAHATDATTCLAATDGASCDSGLGTCSSGACQTSSESTPPIIPTPTTVTQTTATQTTATTPDPNANKPGSETPTDPGFFTEVLGDIVIWIMKLFAFLVGVAMITLNYAVSWTVIGMGDHVTKLTGVGVTWRILRDIGNILFIFGFLAVGISVILNSEWYGGGMKKMLPMLIVGAVFLNFSLFITEAIIDTGNLFATQIYTQINNGQKLTNPNKEVISGKIMNTLGLQTIFSENGIEKIKSERKGNILFIGVMGIVLCIVTAFVMFSLAFILISRFVILLFLIILAPLGFAGLAIPQLKSTAKKWWDTLVEQTITAPVLILLLYIALSVITDANFLLGSNRDWLGAIPGKDSATNIQGFASLLISFLIAMGLLVAVAIVSKQLSAFGAGMAMKGGQWLSFGAVSLATRATLGGAGNLMHMGFKGRTGRISKAGNFAGEFLRNRTYDIRNVPGIATGLGELKSHGVDTGKGATITAGKAHEAQYGWKIYKDRRDKIDEEHKKEENERKFKDAQAAIKKEKAALDAKAITQVVYDANVARHEKTIASTLSRMSTKQLESLDGIKKGTDALVSNLSPQQFESLMKSDKLSDKEHDNLRSERFKDLNTKIDKATTTRSAVDIDDARKALAGVNQKEFRHLDRFDNDFVADNMTSDQYDYLRKEGVLNEIQKQKLNTRREERFDPSKTPPADVASAIKSIGWSNHDQINKLKPETLTDTGVLKALGDNALDVISIARKGKMSIVDRKKLGTYLTSVASDMTDPRHADFDAYFKANELELRKESFIP